MADPDAVAKAFVDHYYATFDTNRAALGALYAAEATLSFEGQKSVGQAAILTKLTGLPFQQCTHRVSSTDTQPAAGGGILVFVTGQLLPEGETNPLKFSQAFVLAPVGGSWAVSNDVFRLNYA